MIYAREGLIPNVLPAFISTKIKRVVNFDNECTAAFKRGTLMRRNNYILVSHVEGGFAQTGTQHSISATQSPHMERT